MNKKNSKVSTVAADNENSLFKWPKILPRQGVRPHIMLRTTGVSPPKKAIKTCVTDTQLLLDIQTFIRENVGRRVLMGPALPYSEVTVTKVFQTKRPRTFFVHVKGKGSHYCSNTCGNDDRHSIYFEISHDYKSARKFARWVYQRCFCSSATAGHSGLCREYRNKEVEFPANLRARLFKEKVPVVTVPVATTDVGKMLSILDPTLNWDDFRVHKREREADLALEEPSKGKQLKTE